ncbi:MAG: MBL fold metallo-hydrolase [Gallionellales bacterium 35-53-114]|jgi:glyoxylase-like metal-dependent hydrolase (beta-lactamase superfamily II)|nr:MAG: MBL fold metallo-hydrolase [Gallionellales bacterium 35-53-114]OYZ64309.1 MAG: MBL fold metallo-hydrolase [Gallionellales bacterium 24-53-125]OZB10383.1 MAG: MBL fold metallo-hydrolase [Gallionellales bacterium 39-52-133]HQS56992.1 MBL fold metallo-hydrolase [Gallionellaceae bacterium]HQS75224.1 MBL fold metallo-hydrolase [Gallionellaceae bacterium]
MSGKFIFSALLSGVLLSFAQAGVAGVTVKPLKVSAHAYYVQGEAGLASSANEGFMSNAAFVVTDEGVVVFDTLGTAVLGQKLVEAIRQVTDKPIKRVIVSHYHADHIYGLQVFQDMGAEIWAHKSGQDYLASETATRLMSERRETLFPWVDDKSRLVAADKWLEGDTDFKMGGLHFELRHVGPAHAPDDMVMVLKEDGVLFAGDLIFIGRVPYVGDADSRSWLVAIDRLIAFKPKYLITGHGAASSTPVKDLELTRDYLRYLRKVMGKAVEDFVPFAEAYDNTDWSQFSSLPAFKEGNRENAYNTYLLMERESMQ